MTAIKAHEIDALIRRGPDPRIAVILVYGPDAGLVSERSRSLIARLVDAPDDPFAFVRLDGDALSTDPGRLLDEAGTVGLFGGSRTLMVRAGGKNFAPAIDALLGSAAAGTKVVVEAGDLGKSAPLRTLCEKSPRALALPCYPDDARALAAVIDQTLAAHGLRATREARDLLSQSLGSDRRASLSELEKLALYAHGTGQVELEDVEAVISDVAGNVLNALVDAAFAGQGAMVERDFRRFRHEGLDASAMLGAALRHALALLSTRLEGGGSGPGQMVANWRGLHFRRKSLVETHLARWSPSALRSVVAALQEATLAVRRASPDLAYAQASAVLLRIAGEAARRR